MQYMITVTLPMRMENEVAVVMQKLLKIRTETPGEPSIGPLESRNMVWWKSLWISLNIHKKWKRWSQKRLNKFHNHIKFSFFFWTTLAIVIYTNKGDLYHLTAFFFFNSILVNQSCFYFFAAQQSITSIKNMGEALFQNLSISQFTLVTSWKSSLTSDLM